MKKSLFIITILVILVLGVFVVSQKLGQEKNSSDKISIVSTLFPIYDFAKEIGGDKVSVSLLLPPGLEAHSFEPKPSDIVKINQADIFVYTGELMEPWADDIIKALSNEVKIVDSSLGVEFIEGPEHEGEDDDGDKHEGEDENKNELEAGHKEVANNLDPHIWLDFKNAKIMAATIAEALKEIDPENADYYQKNLENYQLKLTELDNHYLETLITCKSREIIHGGHYAFGFLSRNYNLEYQAAQGFAPNSEPTASDLVYLVEEIKANNIDYIFYEELLSPKIAQTLANETKTKLLLLNAAHNLTRDDYQSDLTFISIMRTNLKNLSLGLDCELK